MPFLAVIFLMSFAAFSLIWTMFPGLLTGALSIYDQKSPILVREVAQRSTLLVIADPFA